MRPFYSRSAEEQRESRDEWRQCAVDRGWGSPTADRSFLDDEDEDEDDAYDDEVDEDLEPPAPRRAASSPRGAVTKVTPGRSTATRAADPGPSAAAPLAPPPAPVADPAAEPAAAPPDTGAPEAASADTLREQLAALVEDWDEVSLRLLSERLYPLLVDDLRRELLTGHQRLGFL
ncbi:hypothetical protein EF918_28705 [Streptomyces sp. WAC06614]|nr:hypothetical protein EF918_28705 [Streptomyces sp. WAC06614]